MFGKFAYFINGNMFTGVHLSYLFLRLSQEDRNEALLRDGIMVFEPRAGLVMNEYIVLSTSILKNKPLLTDLLQKSITYVSGLPLKVPKQKKAK